MQIKPLRRVVVEGVLINEKEEGLQTTRLPNNLEMMEKINEIVTKVNQMDSLITSRQIQELFKPRIKF